MKYLSIDLETTGVDVSTCQIIEFAAILDDLKDQKPLEELPYYHAYILNNTYTGEPFGLSMHAEIFKNIALRKEGYNYVYASNLGKSFKNFLVQEGIELSKETNKAIINVAGKNFAAFDLQFLNKLEGFEKHIKIRQRILDPAILFFDKNIDDALPGLNTCLQRANIEKNVEHKALADAFDVIKLIRHKLG